mgnify:CR=1 FL=1
MSTEDLGAFLRRQSPSALADLLIELANDHPDVHKRLQRLQLSNSPSKLAAAFKKTLAGWRRSQKYHDYKSVGAFAAKLELWLDQVARELAPKDPALALDLFEAFIEAVGQRQHRGGFCLQDFSCEGAISHVCARRRAA